MARLANPMAIAADSHAPLTIIAAHTQKPSHQFVSACQITIIKHYRSQIQLTSLTWLALVIGRDGNEQRREVRVEIIRSHQVENGRGGVEETNTWPHAHSDGVCKPLHMGWLLSKSMCFQLRVKLKSVPYIRWMWTVCLSQTCAHTLGSSVNRQR